MTAYLLRQFQLLTSATAVASRPVPDGLWRGRTGRYSCLNDHINLVNVPLARLSSVNFFTPSRPALHFPQRPHTMLTDHTQPLVLQRPQERPGLLAELNDILGPPPQVVIVGIRSTHQDGTSW